MIIFILAPQPLLGTVTEDLLDFFVEASTRDQIALRPARGNLKQKPLVRWYWNAHPLLNHHRIERLLQTVFRKVVRVVALKRPPAHFALKRHRVARKIVCGPFEVD